MHLLQQHGAQIISMYLCMCVPTRVCIFFPIRCARAAPGGTTSHALRLTLICLPLRCEEQPVGLCQAEVGHLISIPAPNN